MNFTSLIGLMNNAALLLALGLLYDVLPLRGRAARPGLAQALSGLAVGTLGIVVMLNAWVLLPGVIFDTRSVLLALSGLFFGPIPTVIACAMTSAYRYFVQGGGGALMGVSVIWTSGALGLLWRRLHRGRLEEISPGRIYLLGLAVHLAMVGWMTLLPGAIRPEARRLLVAPVMIVHPIATLLLGLVLSGRHVRQQAEAATRASEERLRLLTENLREVVSLRGERGERMLYVSPAYEKIWGRPRAELLRDPQAFLQSVHPEDRERVLAAQRALYHDGIPLDIEYRIIRPDGALRWIAARTYPAPDENGAITRYAGIAEDITERKQAEADARAQERALRESEQRYHDLIEAANEGIWVGDVDFRITLVNQRMAEMLGYPPEEIIGRPGTDFMPPEDQADARAHMAERRAGRAAHYERRFVRRDGSIIITTASASPLTDENGRFIGSVALFTDITDRKQSEQALRESEARYRTLVEATHEGVWATDAEFRITFVNQQLAEMLGYRPEELIGQQTIQLMPPDEWEDATRQGIERRAGQAGHYERRLARRDGSVITTLASGAPLFDERGEFAGSVTLFTDITERKQTERALADSERHFRSLIESAQEGIWEADAQHRTTFVNRQMTEMLGYAPEEMLGRPVSDFVAPDDLADHRALMAERRAGRPGHYERRFLRRDGSVITTLVSATPLLDEQGAFVGTVALFTDITERKLTEEALRLQGMVLDQIQDGVTITDLEGVITYVNDAECRMLQRSRSELIGAPVATQQEIIATTRARGEWRGEVVNYAADGSAILLDTRTQLVRDAAGRPVAMCGIATDITARRQAEQAARDQERALRLSEDRYRLALEGADLGAWDWNVTTGEVIFNDRWAGMLGYTREELAPHLSTWERLVHPDDLARANQAIADHIEGRTAAYECEHRLRHKDGHWVWVLDRGQAIERDSAGRGVRLCGTHLDITARKLAEAAMRESEERFRRLVESAPDAIFVQTNSRFAYVNAAAVALFGADAPEQLLGQPVPDRFPPEFRETVIERIHRLNIERQSVPSIEEAILRLDGSTTPVEVSAVPMTYQGQNGALVFMRDITGRRQAQAANQRFFNILNASVNELYMFDAQTLRFQFVSAGALRNLGYTMDEMRQMTPLDIKPEFTPDTFDSLAAPLRRRETSVVTFETVHRRKNSATYPVAVNLQLLGEGAEAVFLAVVLDITERKQAESDRLRLEEQLAQARRLESIGMLAGGVAHDLNNTLTPILGYGQLLRDDLPADDPHRMELDEIVLSAERARDLVRQLLAFARRQNLVMQPLDLNRVVGNLYNMLRRTLRENIAIETHLTPGLGAISGDVGQIEQAILNLAVNAQDAMPQGGALTLETSALTLDEEYAQAHEGVTAGPYVLLTVSDTGVGMDKRTLAHIFEPFFTTKEVGKGVGLGLATVYGIVKQHGGHITAYSEPGLGSTFRLYFPRAGEPLAEGGPARDAARPPRGSETILLVEDQDQVRVLARQLLQRQGYTVLDARNGQAALTIAAAHSGEIHLLVTDVVMPDLNGPALSKRLTAVRPEMKTLYMSGYADEVIAPHGVLAQGEAFIQKPFSLPDFVARVRAVLDGE